MTNRLSSNRSNKTTKRRHAFSALLVVLFTLTATTPIRAQERIVVVNGVLLNANGLRYIDSLNCGVTVPNGRYWLNLTNRTWGLVGTGDVNALPVCRARETAPAPPPANDCKSRYKYHEDRMCYCYGVC